MSITIIERTKKGRNGKATSVFKAEVRVQRDGETYRKSKTLSDKKMAQKWAFTTEEKVLEQAEKGSISNLGVTIGQALQMYAQKHNPNGTWGRTKTATISYLQKCKLSTVKCHLLSTTDVLHHIEYRYKTNGVKPSTIYNDIQFLKSSLKIASAFFQIQYDPKVITDAGTIAKTMGYISHSKCRNRRPTIPELDRILNFFNGSTKGSIPMKECILFLLFSGRRDGEMCSLRWDDLDRNSKQILVRDMKHPRSKAGNNVSVLLPDEAFNIAVRQPRTSDLIFPYNPKSVSSSFTKAMKVLGIRDLRLHDLRHECCSWLGELKLPVQVITKVSGHRNWNTLARYTHVEQFYDKYQDWKWRPSQLSP